MFMRQMAAKNLESQIIVIKSPRNLYACLNSEFQWLFYNLSPNTCNVDIVCNRFEGGDCGSGDYVLQIFSIQHWNLAYKVYHNDKKGNENEKICNSNEIHHRKIVNNHALIIDLLYLRDTLDVPEDEGFSCRITYDCGLSKKTPVPVEEGMSTTTSSYLGLISSSTKYPAIDIQTTTDEESNNEMSTATSSYPELISNSSIYPTIDIHNVTAEDGDNKMSTTTSSYLVLISNSTKYSTPEIQTTTSEEANNEMSATSSSYPEPISKSTKYPGIDIDTTTTDTTSNISTDRTDIDHENLHGN